MNENETIPDGEHLFKYVRPEALPLGQTEIPPGVFNDQELSCDWEKHRNNPNTSFHIQEGKTLIIQITVHDEIRNPTNPKRIGKREEAWKQEIIYAPVTEEMDKIHGANIAHSLIKGKKRMPVLEAIQKNARFY